MKLKTVCSDYEFRLDEEFNGFMDTHKDIHIIKIINSFKDNDRKKHLIYIYYYSADELRSKKIQSLLKPNIEFDES